MLSKIEFFKLYNRVLLGHCTTEEVVRLVDDYFSHMVIAITSFAPAITKAIEEHYTALLDEKVYHGFAFMTVYRGREDLRSAKSLFWIPPKMDLDSDKINQFFKEYRLYDTLDQYPDDILKEYFPYGYSLKVLQN